MRDAWSIWVRVGINSQDDDESYLVLVVLITSLWLGMALSWSVTVAIQVTWGCWYLLPTRMSRSFDIVDGW